MNDSTAAKAHARTSCAAADDASRTPVSAAPAGWWARLRGPPPALNLALQGGGAHGAFTWGVLEALLAQPQIHFEGLSGSSAGAMNAVVMADGWLKGGRDGGREGARQALAEFWTAVGQQLPPGLVSQGHSDAIELTPAAKLLANWAGWFSPAQLNPFDLNPLRDLLERQIDFERLRAASPFKLFIGTTQASSGRLRVFREHELTAKVLLASSCLPRMHHAVEIDGESYWDGGYSANPAVFPLFYECEARDVLLVLLAPLQRDGTPRTREEIDARIAELAFSGHFMREMRMFAQATAFARQGRRPAWSGWTAGRLERRLQRLHFHLVDASDLPSLERTETKLLAYGPFLERLRAQGRERGAQWLAGHAADLGRRSSFDIHARFG
jgi:NTE family protein